MAELPDRPPLSADEVQALPDGTGVVVLWSGGNGPAQYVIARSRGYVYAALPAEQDPKGVFRFYNPLGTPFGCSIGAENWQTKVWLDPDRAFAFRSSRGAVAFLTPPELDVAQALRGIDSIESALTQATQEFRDSLNAARERLVALPPGNTAPKPS